jgi:hypothetical protein
MQLRGSAVEDAARERGLGEMAARFLAAVGLLALDTTYHRWVTDADERSYREHAAETLAELVAQASEPVDLQPRTEGTALAAIERAG